MPTAIPAIPPRDSSECVVPLTGRIVLSGLAEVKVMGLGLVLVLVLVLMLALLLVPVPVLLLVLVLILTLVVVLASMASEPELPRQAPATPSIVTPEDNVNELAPPLTVPQTVMFCASVEWRNSDVGPIFAVLSGPPGLMMRVSEAILRVSSSRNMYVSR